MAAEHLTNKTITWQSIWYEGDLVVGQGRRRLYWAFDNRAQSGVTGLTGTGVTVSDDYLDRIAIKSIIAADQTPHGIYSVDLCFDWDGVPNPTEINIGKFFTTHHFISRAGCNMPYILVQLAFDEYEREYNYLNPCEENLHWIRGIDTLPKLVTGEEVDAVVNEYAKNMIEVRSE
jgi:carbamoyl-phosphate synthase large subunit